MDIRQTVNLVADSFNFFFFAIVVDFKYVLPYKEGRRAHVQHSFPAEL